MVEEYSSVTIYIQAKGRNRVEITVLDDDGEQFFDSSIVYKVTKDRNGGYTLRHEKNNGSVITIDKDGRIEFLHPKVNIDGEYYTLQVTGERNN